MREEIAAAVVFITRLIKGQAKDMTAEQISQFSEKLSALMLEKFKNHWYEDDPTKGQGYRCIRINENDSIDPMIEQAAVHCGMKYGELKLPLELTLWIDPSEVAGRFGENIGSHLSIAKFAKEQSENNANSINIESLIEKQNEARNKIISRLRVKSPSTNNNQYSPSKATNKYSPVYQGQSNKSRNNSLNHKAKQFQPSKHQAKFTAKTDSILTVGSHTSKKSDRFHWAAKTGAETVEVKS